MVFGMPPFVEVLWISVFLGILMSIIYRVLTDPRAIKQLKEDMNDFKKRSREAQKAGNKEEANRLTSEMMKLSSKQMKSNMRPMLASLVIFAIALWLIAANYGPQLIQDTQEIQIEGIGFARQGIVELNGNSYDFASYEKSGLKIRLDLNGNGDFMDEEEYAFNEVLLGEDTYLWKAISNQHSDCFLVCPPRTDVVVFAPDLLVLPFELPFIGGTMNWFWWYLIITIPVNVVFRKLLGVE